ncbi:SDR family oxidoreductase [Pseudoduganella lutea]|uniref:dTDP-4-dehydrorhamnose reductase n=1 Tax=Pseudoduganella lutea TaxID=321985 RepID=A0A4P6KZ06_9BURK|nr:sugar nucleotide-binding protein [Pseudoduganella lutea]QBE64015.1 NAD-dependent epimerase/dehydratase family protein [Pseudoduganella lutea]
MKILLTGAGGLLGSAINAAATARGWTCRPMPRPPLPELPALLDALLDGECDLVIHAAANTNVEACEADPPACYRDNLLLTELIATGAVRANARMLFVSSTGVYGAHGSEPYCEYDAVQPTTHHHRSKALAEERVLTASPRNLVVRTGWLFGGPPANPKNFVARRIDEARAALAAGTAMGSNTQQRGIPCWSDDVAARMLDLAASGLAGTFNCVNNGTASRHEYVSEIVRLAGLPLDVQPTSAAAFNRKARVSDNEMAANWKFDTLGWPPMPDWRDSLATYLATGLAVHVNGESAGK